MKCKKTISFEWTCKKIKGKIPSPLSEALIESAEERIFEMMKEGYISGQLDDYVNIDIDGMKTPEDGWECHGWWKADESFVEGK